MRIAYLCQYFHPEPAAPSARLLEFGRAWQRLGHQVTVLTGMPNHPTGLVPSRYRGRVAMEERVDGVRVLRSWLYPTPNRGVVRKGLNHLSFAISSVALGLPRLGAIDVVIVSSPSLLSAVSAAALARARRVPFVFEVRDLWPAAMADLQVIRGRPLLRALERLELALYGAAAHVVVVTEGFKANLVARGVPADKVSVIPNGADTAFFRPLPADPALRSRLGVGEGSGGARDAFLVAYFGAHGLSHGLEVVLEAARQHADRRVRYLLVGDGAERPRLLELRARLGLDNVVMLPSQPRADMPALYAAADVCLVPLRPMPIFRSFVPSKMFEIMACGRPILSNVQGEARAILERSGAALLVPPGDPLALAHAVETLAADRPLRATLAESGRRFVVAHYDRSRLAEEYAGLLESIVRRVSLPLGAG